MRILIEGANTAVAVENGFIVESSGSFDRVIELPDGEVRPGLINAHEHLHRNHYGRLGKPLYANAYEWARDIQVRHADEIKAARSVPRRRALLHGAWKNLISGVTTVVHHDSWEPDFDKHFPLRVVRIASADSLGLTPHSVVPHAAPFALHVAEGVDQDAADEVRILAARGVLTRDFIAVHVVGPDADGVAKLRASGCAVVWCPTSNTFLFGRTAPAALLADGMDVLIGTDSLLTGAGTMLDELRAARGGMSDARLLEAVGPLAARRLGLAEPSLAPGAPADLVVFRRPILDAEVGDIALVMVAGEFCVLDLKLVPVVQPTGGQMLNWCGVQRWIGQEPLL